MRPYFLAPLALIAALGCGQPTSTATRLADDPQTTDASVRTASDLYLLVRRHYEITAARRGLDQIPAIEAKLAGAWPKADFLGFVKDFYMERLKSGEAKLYKLELPPLLASVDAQEARDFIAAYLKSEPIGAPSTRRAEREITSLLTYRLIREARAQGPETLALFAELGETVFTKVVGRFLVDTAKEDTVTQNYLRAAALLEDPRVRVDCERILETNAAFIASVRGTPRMGAIADALFNERLAKELISYYRQ